MMITLFTRPGCIYCIKAKELLETKDVLVYQIVLDEQVDYEAAKAEMVRLTGQTSVPQIFIGSRLIPGGYTGLKTCIESGEFDTFHNEPPVFPVSDKWKISIV
jgi:glutaredoxin